MKKNLVSAILGWTLILALAAAGSPEIQDIFQDENVEAMQCGREVWKMDDDLFGNILVEKNWINVEKEWGIIVVDSH